jgi:hypothetical protein
MDNLRSQVQLAANRSAQRTAGRNLRAISSVGQSSVTNSLNGTIYKFSSNENSRNISSTEKKILFCANSDSLNSSKEKIIA